MTVSALAGGSQTNLVQQLLASLQSTLASTVDALDPADSTGSSPVAASSPATAAGSPPPPPPAKPDGTASDLFSSDTLAGLMQAQEQPTRASQAAADLIAGADTDGSGALSLAEITQALDGTSSTSAGGSGSASTPTSSALQAAFAKLDTNGDGQLDASEIATGLQQMRQAQQGPQAHHGHGRHHHHAYQAAAATTTAASTPATSAGSTADATAATDVTA